MKYLRSVLVASLLLACGSPSDPDAGMDAGDTDRDGGVDAGHACASNAECVESATAEGHLRLHCVGGFCVEDCSGDGECADHPYGPVCVASTCGCSDASDCPGYPAACSGNRCVQCLTPADCRFARSLLCDPSGQCARCALDTDCEDGRTCVDRECVGPDDMDGDGYASADDCDDADPAVFPGALPVCGNGAREGCGGGAWDALATQLGAAEAGQAPLLRVLDAAVPEALITSVGLATLADRSYVAVAFRAPPMPGVPTRRVARLFEVGFDTLEVELDVPLAGLDCGGPSPVDLEDVERLALDVADDGAVHLALGATVDISATETGHYLARYVVEEDGARLERCELADDTSQFGYVAVGLAPDSGDVAGYLRGDTLSRDNVLHRFGAPTETRFRSRDWLSGEGPIWVARERPTAGGDMTLAFGFGGAVLDEPVSGLISAFGQGGGALAAATSGEYAVVLPTDAATYLIEGRCAGASCAPTGTATTWDLALESVPEARWVGGNRWAMAWVRYLPVAGQNVGHVALRGFERMARPLPADPAADAPFVISREGLPGDGPLIVREVAMGSTGDRLEVAVITQSSGGPPVVYLRRVTLCATE